MVKSQEFIFKSTLKKAPQQRKLVSLYVIQACLENYSVAVTIAS